MSSYIEYVHAPASYDDIFDRLAKANSFTSADLESNRNGKVSMDQFEHHLKATLMLPFLLLLAGLLVSFLTRVAFAAYVEKQSILTFIGTLIGNLLQFNLDKFKDVYLTTAGERLPLLVGLFVVTAPAFAYKKLRHIPFRIVIDVLAGKVKKVEGLPWTSTDEKPAPGRAGKKGEMVDVYYYAFKEIKIEVCREGYKAFTDGVRYRVYYLPRSKTLASIEPILN